MDTMNEAVGPERAELPKRRIRLMRGHFLHAPHYFAHDVIAGRPLRAG